MRGARLQIGWPEILFAGVVFAAFVIGGAVFGHVAEILHTCSTSRCQPLELVVEFNIMSGLVSGGLAVLVLLAVGAARARHPR